MRHAPNNGFVNDEQQTVACGQGKRNKDGLTKKQDWNRSGKKVLDNSNHASCSTSTTTAIDMNTITTSTAKVNDSSNNASNVTKGHSKRSMCASRKSNDGDVFPLNKSSDNKIDRREKSNRGVSSSNGSCDDATKERSASKPKQSVNGLDEGKDEANAYQKSKKYCVQIKNEKFWLWEYYKPTGRILGQGAYAVVMLSTYVHINVYMYSLISLLHKLSLIHKCEARDVRTNKVVAIKKNKNVFVDVSDAKRVLRELRLLMHFNHDDVMFLSTHMYMYMFICYIKCIEKEKDSKKFSCCYL
ncbi:protein kinase domain-containing protein [Reticulomyxa filosa]|uniref:Protein kinase domain-containing protein n=1 Tax=Reticulomyxa filosa TaxID=46433 RepID=X6NR67_RETFI|nr:protein kinase domain-containing protein [Reticulomyxa filosa]|eukprot:ETO28383.1 protein kinase domain-containing protein [Reticulomyxa filosa]